MKKLLLIITALLLCSCNSTPISETLQQDTADDIVDEENSAETITDSELLEFNYTNLTWNNTDYVIIEGYEPPIRQDIFNAPVPDFLTEEQQNLYRRAYAAYSITAGKLKL